MGLFTEEIQKTSISTYIEKLSNLDEIEWYVFQQLVESIQMQESGSREAAETIRKKLKHGAPQQKLRVLEVLKLLMENSNQQFHRQFLANEKIKERFEIILTTDESPAVKKSLLSILGTWSLKYKNEPGMRPLIDLYQSNNGTARKAITTRPRSNTDTINTESTSQASSSREVVKAAKDEPRRKSLPPPSKSKPVQSPSTKEAKPKIRTSFINKSSPSSPSTPTTPTTPRTTRVFNFEKAKPKILEEIALANSNSNNLMNALKLINTSGDRWEIELQRDKKLQEHHDKCEESKKKIVRYARLVENEEWIGTLLATNEELLKALEFYDTMSSGQVPAAWSLNTVQSTNLLTYKEPPKKTMRAPPPPPIQRLAITPPYNTPKEEEDPFADPFADPPTPTEDDFIRREYVY